jgi:WD40 repeat protein
MRTTPALTLSALLVAGGLLGAPSSGPAEKGRAPRTDRHGDPLPEGAVARLGTVRLRHPGPIRSLALSPDGSRVASAGGTALCLWDVRTGKLIRQEREEHGISCVAFAPDGKTLAYVSHASVGAPVLLTFLDAGAGRQLRRFTANAAEPYGDQCLAFAPDGQRLATGAFHGYVRLWRTDTGALLHRLDRHGNRVFGVAFSPDGKTLASAGEDKTVRLWDVATGQERLKIAGTELAFSVAFAHDGKTLAWGDGDSVLHLVDPGSGRELRQFREKPGRFRGEGIPGLAFSPDDRVLFSVHGFWDGTIRLWDVATGKEIRRLSGNRADGYAFALSADGRTAALGGENRTVRLWDVPSGKPLHAELGYQGRVERIECSPDGKLLAVASSDRVVRLWDMATRKEMRQLRGYRFGICGLAFAPDGKMLASVGYQDGLVHLWDVATGARGREFRLPEQPSKVAVCFSADGKLIACGGAQAVLVWETATGKEVGRLSVVHTKSLAFAPDRPVLAVADQGKGLRAWDPVAGRLAWTPPPPDAKADKRARLLDPQANFQFLRFSEDGTALVSVDQLRRVGTWDGATGKGREGFQAPGLNLVKSAALSPDGQVVLLGGWDNEVSLWEIATGTKVRSFPGHMLGVPGVAIAPDGRMAFSGSEDTTVLIWDLTGRAESGKIRPMRLSAQELTDTWEELGNAEAARGYRALWRLVAAGEQAVSLLKQRLGPAPETKRLTTLIARLNDTRFSLREKALRELENLADLAEPAVRRALAGKPPLETERRLKQLLGKIEKGIGKQRRLQRLRGIIVLEQVGTAEARALLRAWAEGGAEAPSTAQTRAALRRLATRQEPSAKR